jgi:hypothetical protein
MDANSTRVMHISRWKGAIGAALLAAASFSAVHAASPPRTETSSLSGQPASALASNVAHDIAITQVDTGQEGLELSASLDSDGGTITRDIDWTLRDSDGDIVFQRSRPVAVMSLKPGDYTVELAYGMAHMSQRLTLLEGNQLRVNFILNIGGIRILPRLKGLATLPVPSETKVYANSGADKGRLIATSEIPGEILRVVSGEYRVESRFMPGNAVAVTDVTVKPGIMSSVEIDHIAGYARLTATTDAVHGILWQVTSSTGENLLEQEAQSLTLILKPGTYTARAQIGAELRTAQFVVKAGEASDIALAK